MHDSPSLSTTPTLDASPGPPSSEVLAATSPPEFPSAASLEAASAWSARSVEMHLIWLIIAIAVLLASILFSANGETAVYWPGTQTPLPALCHMKRITGLDCPGCGLTRCFISLAHGDAQAAWHFNPAGVLLFVLVAAQIPYRGLQIWRIKTGRGAWRHARLNALLSAILVSLLLLQWFWKLFEAFYGWNG